MSAPRAAAARLGLLAAALFIAATNGGCALTDARPVARTDGPAAPVAQQSGQANVATQAAVEYHSDLPWKAVVMLMSYVVAEGIKQTLIVYLSHRREMRRITNGRRSDGSLHLYG